MTLRPVHDVFVTAPELAELMDCSVATVYRLKKAGMPYVSWTGTMIRYRPQQAMAWAAAHGEQKRKVAA